MYNTVCQWLLLQCCKQCMKKITDFTHIQLDGEPQRTEPKRKPHRSCYSISFVCHGLWMSTNLNPNLMWLNVY